MNGKEPQWKEYPEQIKLDEITLTKSHEGFYLKFLRELEKPEIDNFLDEKKELIESKFEPTDRRIITSKDFNLYSGRTERIIHNRDRTAEMDKVISTFELDERIDIASPIYFREDLKYPNGFALKDQILVKPSKKARKEEIEDLFQKMGITQVTEIGKSAMLVRVLDKKKQNTYRVAQELDSAKIVLEYAHVNWIQLHNPMCVVPNDAMFGAQWNLRNTGQQLPDGGFAINGCDIKVTDAWDISTGSPLVVIAILDTGCDLDHEDLLPQYVQRNRCFDVVRDSNWEDTMGHGTWCAGIAASLTNSTMPQGVAGVGWKCRIMPIRVKGENSLSMFDVAKGLQMARENKANIASMSLGLSIEDTTIREELILCDNADMVLVAASGNFCPDRDDPPEILYPAREGEPVIAVGASNEKDWRCTTTDWSPFEGSQFGPQLSVVAPGVHIPTTAKKSNYESNKYGTSMATPHVAGLAGLMLAYNPTLKPVDIKRIIQCTAEKKGADTENNYVYDSAHPCGWNKFMGYGRINAAEAMKYVKQHHPYGKDHPNGPADVFIRNSLTDDGTVPYQGSPLCYSPDIIVRQSEVYDPHLTFADKTIDPGSDAVAFGEKNYIYVRVHNKGAIPTDIHVRLYYAPLATTCTPDQWHYLDQYDFYNVDPNTTHVSDTIIWEKEKVPDPSATGHFCMIASIEGVQDPHPDPIGITDSSQYMNFIRNNNNICYRNLVFEEVLPGAVFPIHFFMSGFSNDKHKSSLRITRKREAIPTSIKMRFPAAIFDEKSFSLENAFESTSEVDKGFRTFEIMEKANTTIAGFTSLARQNPSKIEIKVPANALPGETYELAVQQLANEMVLGDFQVMCKVIDPQKRDYVAIRGRYGVHKKECKSLEMAEKQSWVPFKSLETAKCAGYDMALDCLNQQFSAKDVSHNLAKKVLAFLNRFESAQDLNDAFSDNLDMGYFEQRYGKDEAKRRSSILVTETAKRILAARGKVGRFNKLEELETIEDVDKDMFVDLVNSFKR